MSRTERIFRLQEFLQSRDRTTIAEIAAEFSVSERTVLRDLGELRKEGLLIESDSGPGGGIWLKRSRGVASVHLTIEEVVALWVASTVTATSAGDLPWASAAGSALTKLLASVSPDKARAMRNLCERVVVRKPAGPRALATMRDPPRGILPIFENSFTRGVCLEFEYRDRNDNTSTRLVEPHGLLVEPPLWYVLAWDRGREAPRMFRMDRIQAPRARTDQPFSPNFQKLTELYEQQLKERDKQR